MTEVQERPPLRSRLLRLFRTLSAFACVAVVASCSTYMWSLASGRQPEPSLLAGFQNLGLQPGQTQQFTERLNEHFPIGSREADLVRELWVEGFKPITDLSSRVRKAPSGRILTNSMSV